MVISDAARTGTSLMGGRHECILSVVAVVFHCCRLHRCVVSASCSLKRGLSPNMGHYGSLHKVQSITMSSAILQLARCRLNLCSLLKAKRFEPHGSRTVQTQHIQSNGIAQFRWPYKLARLSRLLQFHVATGARGGPSRLHKRRPARSGPE